MSLLRSTDMTSLPVTKSPLYCFGWTRVLSGFIYELIYRLATVLATTIAAALLRCRLIAIPTESQSSVVYRIKISRRKIDHILSTKCHWSVHGRGTQMTIPIHTGLSRWKQVSASAWEGRSQMSYSFTGFLLSTLWDCLLNSSCWYVIEKRTTVPKIKL